MTPIILAAALLFQQQPVQRDAPGAPGDSARNVSRQVIMDVGRSVADLRTAHDQLRRAVFNLTGEAMEERAQEMQQSCGDLAALARASATRMCRSCFGAAAQRAVDGYRAALPTVVQVGARCVSQLSRARRERDPSAALKRIIYAISRNVVEGLRTYEVRLQDVRRAFGLVPPRQPSS